MHQINSAERFFYQILKAQETFLYNFHAFGVLSAFKRALKMAQLISQPRHLKPGAYDVTLVSDFDSSQRIYSREL